MAQAAAPAIEEGDPALEDPFILEVVKQIRALDTYGTYQNLSEARILDPFVLTKERKKEIPLVGEPDEQTINRVKVFYNALAAEIERRTGLMASPVVNVNHEGFGRMLILVGKLAVQDKPLRDVHRFGFSSLQGMRDKADQLAGAAENVLEQFPEAARA